jgi:hypothetical protein
LTLYRFTIWNNDPKLRKDMPTGVVRHGISVEIEAGSYQQAIALLVDGYADGKHPLVVGPATEWFSGKGETIVSMGMRQPDRTREPS